MSSYTFIGSVPTEKQSLEQLGKFIQNERLRKNMTQAEVSHISGISRRTITQLENGHGGTLLSLLQVLYAIQRLDVWSVFEVSNHISPLALVKLKPKHRRRATSAKNNFNDNKAEW